MSALLVLLVAESFVFGAMWHNKSGRSGLERESERPDPAVLFYSRKPKLRKQAGSVQLQIAMDRPQSIPQMRGSTIPFLLAVLLLASGCAHFPQNARLVSSNPAMIRLITSCGDMSWPMSDIPSGDHGPRRGVNSR